MKKVVDEMMGGMQIVEQENQQVINPDQTCNMGAYEIAPGMTSEQIQAEFFNYDALREQPEPVYRLDSSGHRYYYTFDKNGDPRFFVSVTTMIKQNMPTSPQLIEWIAKMGVDESKRYAADRASYGTFMHAQIGSLLINRTYDLDQLKEELRKYIEKEKLPVDFINYADDFKKDILAFAQFMRDTNLKPLAIELVLTHPEDGYAGALDLAAEIEIEEKGFFGEVYKTGANAGKPKETKRKRNIRAIIDFKSGRKGFFPEHEIQLHAYKEMWNLHFPDMPIEKVFNWSPKDWRGTAPTYNFKDQTDSKEALRLPFIVGQAKLENDRKDNTVVFCSGKINLDDDDFLDGNVIAMSLAEVVKNKKQNIDPDHKEHKENESEEIPDKAAESSGKFDSKEEKSASDTNANKEEKKRLNAKSERNKKLENLLNDDDL